MKRLIALATALLLLTSIPVWAQGEYQDIMPVSEDDAPYPTLFPVMYTDPAAVEALERITVYYAAHQPESWEDIIAAFALNIPVDGMALPEDLSLPAQILCALALGLDPSAPAQELADAQAEDGGLGESLTEHIYAQLALKLTTVAYDADAAMAYLLAAQGEDGRFEAWGGVAEPTGLALLVLEDESAAAAAAFLLTQMTETGGFIGYPEFSDQPDACATATALSGLIAAGAEVPPEMIEHLISYQDDETGAFRFTADGEVDPDFATPQCARALGELAYGSVYTRLAVDSSETPEESLERYADWDLIPEWGREAALFALESGLMDGDEQRRFNPAEPITRSELAGILMKLGLGSARTESFDTEYADVRTSDWYAEAIHYVSEYGLMGGYDGHFRPYEQLTREQIAFCMARALDLQVTIEDREPSDLNAGTPAYADGVRAMYTEGLMNGSGGAFNPKGSFTRLELAGLLKNLHA